MLDRASSPDITGAQPILFLRISTPALPSSAKSKLISRSFSTPLGERDKNEGKKDANESPKQKTAHFAEQPKKSHHYIHTAQFLHKKGSKNPEDDEFVLDHWKRISRSASFSIPQRSKPQKIAVPEFYTIKRAKSSRKSQTCTTKPDFDFEKAHRLLELIESRIQDGIDQIHKHPALSVAAAAELKGDELRAALEKSLGLGGYRFFCPANILPSYWTPRVWDENMTRLGTEESEALKKKGLECPMPNFRPIIQTKVEMSSLEPSVKPEKDKPKASIRRQVREIMSLTTKDYETEDEEECTDSSLF